MNNNVWCISNTLDLIGLTITILGGIFAFYRWEKNSEISRANRIYELISNFRCDEDVKDFLNYVDYDKKWYTKEFHGNKELESKFDKALTYQSYFCYLYDKKIIKEEEFVFFEYDIKITIENKQIKDYLYNLYHYEKKKGIKFTYDYLYKYAIEKGPIKEDEFKNEKLYKKIATITTI